MSVNRIATRYAKSILDLAMEMDQVELVLADMEMLLKVMNESADLRAFLKSPIIAFNRKRQIIGKLFEGKVSTLTLKFMELLAGKQREMYLPEIAQQYQQQYKNLKHISTVKITSAAELTPEVLATIRQKLENGPIGFENVEIKTKIDPSLVGGFIIELGDYVYDASVRHQLDELRKEFTGNLYQSMIRAR